MKDSYYSSSSVWRSYTTRGQVKGNKEGEPLALLERCSSEGSQLSQFVFKGIVLHYREYCKLELEEIIHPPVFRPYAKLTVIWL